MTLSAKLVLAGHAVVVAVHLGAGAVFQEVRGFCAGGQRLRATTVIDMPNVALTGARRCFARVRVGQRDRQQRIQFFWKVVFGD